MELCLAITFLKSRHRSMKSVAEVKEEPPGSPPSLSLAAKTLEQAQLFFHYVEGLAAARLVVFINNIGGTVGLINMLRVGR